MKRIILAVAVAATLPLALACKKNEPQGAEPPAVANESAAPEATPGEIPGVKNNNPNDISAMKAKSWIDDVRLGKKLGADGTVAEKSDDFAPGDAVYLTMKVSDAPAGSQVKVEWYGPGDQKLGEEAKTIDTGQKTMSFQAKDTSTWTKGDYRAEVWAGDEKASTQKFDVKEKKAKG